MWGCGEVEGAVHAVKRHYWRGKLGRGEGRDGEGGTAWLVRFQAVRVTRPWQSLTIPFM